MDAALSIDAITSRTFPCDFSQACVVPLSIAVLEPKYISEPMCQDIYFDSSKLDIISTTSVGGLVVKSIVAIDGPRVRVSATDLQ